MLSFIPPDGHFDLLRYEAVQAPIKSAPQGRPFALPLVFKPELKLEEAGGTFSLVAASLPRFTRRFGAGKFSLSLTSRVTARPIENIIISLYLGDNVNHVSATPSGDSRGIGSGNAGGSASVLGCVGGGTWEFDPNRRVRMPSKLIGQDLVLTRVDPEMGHFGVDVDGEGGIAGRFVHDEVCHPCRCTDFCPDSFLSDGSPAIPSPAFVVDFQIGQYSFSGVRVDQLKVQGDIANKPFKGIRTFTKSGRYEVRW